MGEQIKQLTLKQELESNYILKNHTISDLKALGFRRYSPMCYEESSYYIYRFPVYKYLGTTTLMAELKANINNGNIIIDVYDMGHDLFSMFYNNITESNKTFLSKIKKIIISEYKKLGVERI